VNNVKAKLTIAMLALVCGLLFAAPLQFVKSQSATITFLNTAPSQTTLGIGQTLTVNITITNVENLYAVDLTLDWNSTVLHLVNAKLNLGTSSVPGGGVLYGSPVSDSPTPGGVYANTSLSTESEFHLIASSEAPAPSYNGTGTIATLTFNVTALGHSDINLLSDITDHPEAGETSEEIIHFDYSNAINATTIPEFPGTAVLALLMICATVAVLLSRNQIRKKTQKTQIANVMTT
jgi:hypothetical protein